MNEFLEILKREKPFLEREFGVEEIALFGSYARGEAEMESDVDVLVKIKEINIKKLVGLLNFLESKFQKKVDLVCKGKHLTERYLSIINKEILYA